MHETLHRRETQQYEDTFQRIPVHEAFLLCFREGQSQEVWNCWTLLGLLGHAQVLYVILTNSWLGSPPDTFLNRCEVVRSAWTGTSLSAA